MDNQTEKEVLYSMMQDIVAERRRLTDQYAELKKRLDEIINDEKAGIQQLPIAEYMRLANKVNKIKESATPSQEAKTKEFKKEVEVAKVKNSPAVGLADTSKVKGLVLNILKEHGAPMKKSDIYVEIEKQLGSQTPKLKNFNNNMLPRIAKDSSKIENVSRGYYQYKF